MAKKRKFNIKVKIFLRDGSAVIKRMDMLLLDTLSIQPSLMAMPDGSILDKKDVRYFSILKKGA